MNQGRSKIEKGRITESLVGWRELGQLAAVGGWRGSWSCWGEVEDAKPGGKTNAGGW